ncbi:AAA family ATPase [Tannerella forsythia]|uniref:ATP-dependent exonuclease n=1 Tax=Tannerella forsythia TaxID=28112 RepID=A0A3P1XWN6_TANFO|nr:AAA family ATPase [Tannerella forsythia]RRD62905.1 ATP-dependent exonuclease [Tannerella forsythia]
MRILAIRGKNLASLEKAFEIDFTAEPLKSAGIFAITGSTGSGKSTLLDALCLALFDQTPRTSHASENIPIRDVGDKTLNQRDCRNILRRGTSEGYAEVDFVSLGRETFRARWSVKRAYNRAEGSMQSSEIRLHNLSTGHEEPGRKTELLARIVDLIGLTFDQFTRSVLLAQGDFATFLKARQPEKAELLEKLTGTDIYSRISIAIYEKSKNADAELEAVTRRIEGIERLSAEQRMTYETEKLTITHELAELKETADRLTAQLKWQTEHARLCDEQKQAERRLEQARQAITEARGRYEYIVQIDRVQEIRDTFKHLENLRHTLSESQANLQTAIHRHTENEPLLTEAIHAVADCEHEQTQLIEKQQQIAPQIVRARELDVLTAKAKKDLEEVRKELKDVQKRKAKTEEKFRNIQEALAQTQKELITREEWFTTHHDFERIAARTELLLSLITEAQTVQEQKQRNEQTLEASKRIVCDQEKEMERLKQEAERLNKIMPAEIVTLRAQLKEGAPCPVCGSLHHPAKSLAETQRMKEQELEQAKADNARRLEIITADLETRKNEITKISALIGNYTEQYTATYRKLEEHLSLLPGWQVLFERAVLAEHLNTRKTEWDNASTALTEAQERLKRLHIDLENEQTRIQETDQIWRVTTEKNEHCRNVLEHFLAERQTVLRGKPADAAEKYFADNLSLIASKLKKSNEKSNLLSAEQKSLSDHIAQRRQDLAKLVAEEDMLQKAVETWMTGKEGITAERLSELLSKSNAWIQAEKQALNTLTEAETTARATLAERNKNLTTHCESNDRPTHQDSTSEALQTCLQEKKQQTEERTQRQTELEVVLTTNARNEKQVEILEKERLAKYTHAENWQKLNTLLGSASGNKFKEIAQGYTLDTLLGYANKHLRELTSRYKLQRVPGSLALQVVDLDMLNEVRTVHSLSGGESFLISLALALGLSSLSSNRMNVESLFIDEGFGSLDNDTLGIAMDALERLQTQGRKIGVISHVSEMTERIAVRISLTKTSNGKSEIRIRATQPKD